MSEPVRPKIGTAVFVWRDGKFLMQQRTGAHGEGTWSTPGGHLEYGESFAECAAREILEETGVIIQDIRLVAVTNDIFKNDGKHYVTLWLRANWKANEPTIQEPHKILQIQWAELTALPQPLFEPCWTNLLRDYPGILTGKQG